MNAVVCSYGAPGLTPDRNWRTIPLGHGVTVKLMVDSGSSAPERLPNLAPVRVGGFLRALVMSLVAAGATIAWLHSTRIERWFAQLEKPDLYYWDRHEVLTWLDEAAPEDPRVTEAFVAEIVRSGTLLTGSDGTYRTSEALSGLQVAAPVLLRRQPPPSEDYLRALLVLYARLESEFCAELVKALGPQAHEKLREASAKIEDPTARYGALLLICTAGAGVPADADSILASVESERPPPTDADLVAAAVASIQDRALPSVMDEIFTPSSRHEAAAKALIGLGDAIVERLVAGFKSRSRAVTNLCARVLRQTSLATLVSETEKRIDEYAESGLLRPAAQNVVYRDKYFRENPQALAELPEGAKSPVPTQDEMDQALAALGKDHHLSNLVAESLNALLDVREGRVDLCFMRALSSPNEGVAKFCAGELRKRLTREQFADTLFRFLAHKGQFWVREVDVYESALKSYGAEVSADIVRNLDRLLAGAAGKPADVFWIHKAIALRCLGEIGDAGAYDVLVKYAADPSGYVLSTKRTDSLGQVLDDAQEEITYNGLARAAAAQIAARTGTPAPELPPRGAPLPDDGGGADSGDTDGEDADDDGDGTGG
jgi:hypothetical protein